MGWNARYGLVDGIVDGVGRGGVGRARGSAGINHHRRMAPRRSPTGAAIPTRCCPPAVRRGRPDNRGVRDHPPQPQLTAPPGGRPAQGPLLRTAQPRGHERRKGETVGISMRARRLVRSPQVGDDHRPRSRQPPGHASESKGLAHLLPRESLVAARQPQRSDCLAGRSPCGISPVLPVRFRKTGSPEAGLAGVTFDRLAPTTGAVSPPPAPRRAYTACWAVEALQPEVAL